MREGQSNINFSLSGQRSYLGYTPTEYEMDGESGGSTNSPCGSPAEALVITSQRLILRESAD